ncbi:MAG: protein-export chaperone SecB [Gammaproteobacteria bacterium]|nr:protein-export chaperone SecB [Gammaproteobacteria bacterium]
MADNDSNPIPPPAGDGAADGIDTAADTRGVNLQRIYCKDASLEVPLAPQIFARNWTPQVDVRLNTEVDTLGEDFYQVVLAVTVTSKSDDQVLFLVEAQQAGVFEIKGFGQGPELGALLGAYCPSLLFPFARETIADLIQRGGFPPVLLQPIDFNAAYTEHLRARAAAAESQPAAGNNLN